MKILIVRTYPSVMNIKNYNSQEIGLAKAFVRAGHICDIVYYAGNVSSHTETISTPDGEPIKIYWLRSFSLFNNGFFFGLRKIMRDYDIIQVSEYDQITSWAIYNFSKKSVYIYHGPYDSDISKKHNFKCKVVDALLLNKRNTARVPVFTKSKLATESIKKRGFKSVTTVGVGLDIDRFEPETEGESEFCRRLAEEKEKQQLKYLLYIGVLEDRRNTKFLLSTFARTLEVEPTTRLVIVGNGKESYVNDCFALARQLGIEDNIEYTESLSQEQLPQLYSMCELFLLPTKFEIFGMVLLEAMAFGCPVITSLNGGSSTLIVSDVYGIIISDFDERKWTDAICSCLSDDKKLHDIAENSRARIKECFTWDTVAATILDEMTGKGEK